MHLFENKAVAIFGLARRRAQSQRDQEQLGNFIHRG